MRIKIIIALLLLVLLAALLISSKKSSAIKFDFSSADVSKVELYHYVVPASAEIKILETENDIKDIMDRLTALDVQQNDNLESVVGGRNFSFRFYLQAGITYEIIYIEYSEGWGKIQSSYDFSYATKADIESIWNDFNFEAQNVPESQLPVYEK